MLSTAGYAVDEERMRTDLFEGNTDLVSRIAHHLALRLPPGHQMDDLIQVGLLGLWEASKRYQPSAPASFKTFAGIYIRGSILDELRRVSWTPRSTQRKSKRITKAIRDAEAKLGRPATGLEIAAELGETIDTYYEMLTETAPGWLVPLDSIVEDGASMEGANSPFGEVEDESFRDHLIAEIDTLPEREQMVLSLYYQEELNMREIGEVLGVGESRVCQIHSQAVSRIRAGLHESWLEA